MRLLLPLFLLGLAPSLPASVETFPLSSVRLLEGPFKQAQDLDRNTLLAHDIDRLLAPFRTEAGLKPRAPLYPNWESGGLGGHTAGHYMTALAQLWVSTGDAEMKRRLDLMVAELAECQQAHGDGYVGGIPKGRALWAAVAQGRLDCQGFSINGAWVPWYNEHKLFAGLRDAWLLAGNRQAREVLLRLADWCDTLVSGLSDGQMQEMLRAEHGGMNEVLADVYSISGDARHLALAQRFSHRALLGPLLRHEDRLDGLHANTQIPKVIGFARIAELGGERTWHEAARFFWETVVQRRSLAFGGNSEAEHFNPPDDFSSLILSREGPETCNTHNMLRLSELLFRDEPAARYADYYERALYNHILASQHPVHGGFVYFTPIRPQHYRTYSQPGLCFWCCVGTGMESHSRHGSFIYAHSATELYVNLFVASELKWPEKDLSLRQETSFPDAPRTRLVLRTARPQRLTIQVRHPAWVAAGALTVRLNGNPLPTSSTPSSYLPLTREWRDGDCIDIELPLRTRLERLPDGSDYVAVLHGPLVLAAKTGVEQLDGLLADEGRGAHVTPGPALPLDKAPMLVGDPAHLQEQIIPIAGDGLRFSAAGVIQPQQFRNLELIPFFRLHDARYVLYWRTASETDYPKVVAQYEASEKTRLEQEARTTDRVSPGVQQSEVDHGFQELGSHSGLNQGRHWRDAGGSFGYRMKAAPDVPMELVVTYDGGEKGRNFEILVNGRSIASVTLEGGQRHCFVERSYAIPEELLQAAASQPLTIQFVARENSRTGSIYGVRLATVRVAAPAP